MAPEPALAPEAAFEAREDAPARTAPAQRPPAPRTQPVQVYRAGDKSELKRLLMQKKQGKA
jgi:chemotaxis protein methyltransferase CheR